MTKKIEGKLLIAPCQSDEIKTKIVNFEEGIISKFEIEKINAELEVLAHKHEMINSIYHQQEADTLWQEISQQGEEMAEQMASKIGKATEFIENELSEIIRYWRFIILGTSVVTISIVSITIKLKLDLIKSIFCSYCFKNPHQREIVAIPINLLQTPLIDKTNSKNINK